VPLITSYLYENIIEVQVLDDDPTIKTRNRIVYSRPVKVYKNIDNIITIQFRNNDQKPANVVSRSFTFALTDSNVTVWSTTANISNVTTAVGTVTLDQANVANLTQEYYNYTVSYTGTAVGNLTLPAYTDDNWGAVGQMQVISNVY
jgi:hypothetical protein